MSKTIKIFGLMMLAVLGLGAMSCSEDDNKEIPAAQLPQDAKSFLSTYYPSVNIVSVKRDNNNGALELDVRLANGHEVSFNADGEWTDVDAPRGESIPAGVAPQAITDYIALNYSGMAINEISKDARGYEVELTNGVDLLFNSDGSFAGIDR